MTKNGGEPVSGKSVDKAGLFLDLLSKFSDVFPEMYVHHCWKLQTVYTVCIKSLLH